MRKEQKTQAIEELTEKFSNAPFFYVTDSSALTVEQVNNLRGKCFEKGVEMKVVKNTLTKKALEKVEGADYSELYDALKGPTALMFSSTANVPAKIIEEFRKSHDKPVLKAAYIDSSIYIGDDQVKALASLKSKEELIGEVILLLQSPAKNVISALSSGGGKLAGLVKALQERAQ